MDAIKTLHDFLYSDKHRKPVEVLIVEDALYEAVLNESFQHYRMGWTQPNTCSFFYGRLLVKLSDVMPTAKNLTHEIQAFALTNEEFGEMFPDYKNN